MAFDNELKFEKELINLLFEKGWEREILKYPTEDDLIQNWAAILFKNNSGIDQLNDVPLSSNEMQQLVDQITKLVDDVETEIFSREEKEIPSDLIGEILMDKLKDLDPVAYVRFASVYREFKDVNTFMNELKKMLQ